MVFDKLKGIIAKELNVDESKITMETSFSEDLGADSLDAIELVMACEDEFGVQIEEEEAQGISTVGDIVKILEKRIK